MCVCVCVYMCVCVGKWGSLVPPAVVVCFVLATGRSHPILVIANLDNLDNYRIGGGEYHALEVRRRADTMALL